MRSLVIFSLALLASAASVAHAQRAPRARPAAQLPRYEIFLIQPLTPGSTSYTSVTSVNDRGLVTGNSSDGGFLWSVAAGAVVLAESPGWLSSSGYDVNLLGMVAGTSGTATLWTDVDTLDFASTAINATAGALDGNAAANRASISATIGGLAIPDGATFWIRWNDLNASGADDGLAVDNFSLTPQGGAPAPNLTINDVSLNEANAGGTTFTFTLPSRNA